MLHLCPFNLLLVLQKHKANGLDVKFDAEEEEGNW